MLSAIFMLSANMCPDKENTLSVTPSELSFEARETERKQIVVITDAATWEYQVVDNWVFTEKLDNLLYVSVLINTDATKGRTAILTVTAGNAPAVPVIITQQAKDQDVITVNPTELDFTATETATKSVTVTTNAPSWDIEKPSNASWITATKSGNNVNVTVSQNSSRSERSANVTIKGGDAADKTFSVKQEGALSSLSVSTSSHTFTSSAGSTSVTVSSNISWTASVTSSNTSWLTVSPSSGANNGTLTISVTVNTGTLQRTGTITVRESGGSGSPIEQTIAITQQGAAPPQQAQIQFVKSFYSADYTQLGVGTTSGTRLASHNFNASAGTSPVSSITPGNYRTLFYYKGDWYYITWDDGSTTFNYQGGYKYIIELFSSGSDVGISISRQSANIAPQDANAPQQKESIQGTLKGMNKYIIR